MTGYVYGQTKTGRGQRRLDAQNRAMVERNKANDDRRRNERRRAASKTPARPFTEVFAEAEQVRQRAVAAMTVAHYNLGASRLEAATHEANQWSYSTLYQRRTDKGREAA